MTDDPSSPSESTCPSCGGTLASGARFCRACGTPVPETPAPSVPDSLCASCGGALASGARFCRACGTPVPQALACASCGAELKPEAKFCRACGTPAGATPPPESAPQPVVAASPPPPLRRVPTKRGFNKKLTGGAAAALLVVAAIGVFLVMRGGGDGEGSKQAAGVTGKFTLGAKVDVASQTIGASGGQIVVGSNGGPIAGMTVDVPQGAFDKDRNFTVSYQPVTASTFPKEVSTVSPLIDIEYGGGRATEPFKVTVPVKIAPGHFVMSFYYDDNAGRLQGIPIAAETSDSVTIATDHFSPQILADAAEQVLLSLTGDSGFKPGTDDWEFPNWGSYLSPGGNCQGQVVSAIYYYVTHRMLSDAAGLHGLFDNNGSPNSKTPDIWQDDSHAYRLASVVQSETQVSWLEHQVRAFDWGIQETDDRLAYLAIAEAIRTTGAPQLLSIARYDAKAKSWSGHAIIAYKVDAGTISVADPNFPGVAGKIKLNGAKFDSYLSGENATAQPTAYTAITYSGLDAFIDFGVVATHWQEMLDGTIGNGKFPEYPLSMIAKTAGG